MSEIKPGDKVAWNTPQGETSGHVTKKLTKTTKINAHTVKASRDNPEFEVQSDSSGKKAAHKPESLHKD